MEKVTQSIAIVTKYKKEFDDFVARQKFSPNQNCDFVFVNRMETCRGRRFYGFRMLPGSLSIEQEELGSIEGYLNSHGAKRLKVGQN